MKVHGSNRFLCLCERSARLWPWLRGQQISSLQEFLLSERDLTFTGRVFESINARFKGHALCDSHCGIRTLSNMRISRMPQPAASYYMVCVRRYQGTYC